MQIEYEIKFVDIDISNLRSKLENLGMKQIHPRFLMKRKIYTNPQDLTNGYIRVRQEFDKITLCYKEENRSQNIDCVKEIEVIIDDFDKMDKILQNVGIQSKSYQETYREERSKDGVKFTIDERPGLPPFLEIEADSEELVKDYVSKLGLDYADGVFGTVSVLYEKLLNITYNEINNLSEITFQNPPVQTALV